MSICTLDAQAKKCNNKCEGCGFNLKEQKMRQKMVAENKLTLCKDGKKRLIIKRKENEK